MHCAFFVLLGGAAADRQEVRAHLARLRGRTIHDVVTKAPADPDAVALFANLRRLHGPRLALPDAPGALQTAWQALFGETFEERTRHTPLLVLLHCFSSERREEQLKKYLTPEYLGSQRHVFASDRTDIGRGILGFPDDPGAGGIDFKQNGRKYLGAHRPLIAMLFANDTWGSRFDWLLQGDDDTQFKLDEVLGKLGNNAHLPLLVGSRGPRGGAAKPECYPNSDRRRPLLDCCLELNAFCPVDVPRLPPLHYEAREGRLTRDGVCGGVAIGTTRFRAGGNGGRLHHECCAVWPSPSQARVDAGYPFTLDLSPVANASTSVARSWTYGGSGYAVSRGLMHAVARPRWRRCVDAGICGNADQRVATCVFNLGYAYTAPEAFAGGLGQHLRMGTQRSSLKRARRRWRKVRRRLAGWWYD